MPGIDIKSSLHRNASRARSCANIKFNKGIDKLYCGTEIIVLVNRDSSKYRTYLILFLSLHTGDNRESAICYVQTIQN